MHIILTENLLSSLKSVPYPWISKIPKTTNMNRYVSSIPKKEVAGMRESRQETQKKFKVDNRVLHIKELDQSQHPPSP